MEQTLQLNLPGRLGDPDRDILNDPRLDPRIKAALEVAPPFGGDDALVPAAPSYEEALAFCAAFEEASAQAHPIMRSAMPDFPNVSCETVEVQGVDDNPIQLYIHRPNDVQGLRPCVVHTHGGGMVLMTAQDPMFVRWRNYLASMGLIVIGVEFRNGGGVLGNHPFPAGLNDCVTATQWVIEQQAALGISHLIISGESGGGNLSIATTLKAHQEGWSNQIAGVFAMCPYISGAYATPPAQLLSLQENDGYMLDCQTMAVMAKVYDPNGQFGDDALAWPLAAAVEQLRGLPPHIVSVNELDPLRDEGLQFARKLMQAGVSVVARTVHGTPHAGDLSFPDLTPDLYRDTADAVVGFVNRLE